MRKLLIVSALALTVGACSTVADVFTDEPGADYKLWISTCDTGAAALRTVAALSENGVLIGSDLEKFLFARDAIERHCLDADEPPTEEAFWDELKLGVAFALQLDLSGGAQ